MRRLQPLRIRYVQDVGIYWIRSAKEKKRKEEMWRERDDGRNAETGESSCKQKQIAQSHPINNKQQQCDVL